MKTKPIKLLEERLKEIKAVKKQAEKNKLPEERLKKLTESYMVSNEKLKKYIARELPLTTKQGIIKTLKSFKNYNF